MVVVQEGARMPVIALRLLLVCLILQLVLVLDRLCLHLQVVDIVGEELSSDRKQGVGRHAFRTDLSCNRSRLEQDLGISDRIVLFVFCSEATGRR